MCHISSFIAFLKHHNTPIYNLQQILLYTAAPYSLNINDKTADISSDYNTCKENKTLKVKNTEISVKGNDTGCTDKCHRKFNLSEKI